MVRLKLIRGLIVSAIALLLAGCGGGAGFDLASLAGMRRADAPSHYGSYLAARQAQYDRDTEAAARLYRQALRSGPADLEILERAYVLEISNGNVSAAGRLAEAALALDPENNFARLTVAVARFRAGDYAEVRELFGEAEATGLTELTFELLDAWSYAGEGDVDQAIEAMGNFDIEGLELFQSYHGALMADLAGNNVEAELGYVAAITGSGGSSVRVVEAYGNFLERMGRSAEAVRIYDAYLELAPGSPIATAARDRAVAARGRVPRLVPNAKAGAAEAMFSIASVAAGERSYDVPALYLQFALYLRPGLQPARLLSAELYERLDFDERAVEVYAEISRQSPLRYDADIQRALILSRMDRRDEAVRLLSELTDADPRSFAAWVGLADTLRSASLFEDAVDAYAQAIGLIEPEDQAAPRFWALYYAYGIALERTGQWEEAEEALQYALVLNEDHPYVLNYLGYSWIEKGLHLDEALAMIHRAVDQRPRDGFIVDSLGWGYYQLGQYDEAVRYLEIAAELTPGDPTINDHLGDAYWRAGMERRAGFQWSHALAMEPDEELIPGIENKLANGLGDQPTLAQDDAAQKDAAQEGVVEEDAAQKDAAQEDAAHEGVVEENGGE